MASTRWQRALGGALAAALLSAAAALAHSTRAGSVEIGHGWALPTAENARETQGFVPLLARGQEDRLLEVTSPRAGRVEIRRSDERGRTTALASLRLQRDTPIGMRPGRLHLAFLELDGAWTAGARIPVTLRFEEGGSVAFEFWVEAAPYATR